MSDVIATEGKTVDDDENHWTIICPGCNTEFEFTGFFDPDELVDCKCKTKIKVERIYFSNGNYIE